MYHDKLFQREILKEKATGTGHIPPPPPSHDQWGKGRRRWDNLLFQNVLPNYVLPWFPVTDLYSWFHPNYRHPSEDLPTSSKNTMRKKNGVFQSYLPTDLLSSFPPTEVFPSTSCRPSTNFCFPADVLWKFASTVDFSRFPPTDDLQRTYPVLLMKIAEKFDVFQRLFNIFAYRRFLEIFTHRRPSAYLPTSLKKK